MIDKKNITQDFDVAMYVLNLKGEQTERGSRISRIAGNAVFLM